MKEGTGSPNAKKIIEENPVTWKLVDDGEQPKMLGDR